MYAEEEDPKNVKEELEQYHWGYMHAIYEVKRKIHLRSRDVMFNKVKLNLNHPSSSLQSEERSKDK